jgi:hypothetical protein
MEFIKKKDGTYLFVKLDKVDTKYLKNFKKYEHQYHVKEGIVCCRSPFLLTALFFGCFYQIFLPASCL